MNYLVWLKVITFVKRGGTIHIDDLYAGCLFISSASSKHVFFAIIIARRLLRAAVSTIILYLSVVHLQ